MTRKLESQKWHTKYLSPTDCTAGLCASGDIFQYKVDMLLGDIEGVHMYIHDILILGKGSLYQHIDQTIVIFDRLHATGLKENDTKCRFWLNMITYLGHIIKREGIKPNPKKVQGIMDLRRSTKMTEARELIGMPQYYKGMWPRRSRVLYPL